MEAIEAAKVALKERYVVDEELGRGGQAMVYKLVRKSDGKLFACKQIRVTDYTDDEMIDESMPDGGLLQEASVEIEALSLLCNKSEKKKASRSGVVELVEVIDERDYCYLVLELCKSSLRDLLLKKKRLREHEAAFVIKKLAKVVHNMHKAGVVHRDIKPGNVLVGFEDNVKLADFGTSYIEENTESIRPILMSGRVGTDRYIAPEACYSTHQLYDERVDVWGLGILLYEMLAGKFAFQGVASRDVAKRMSHYEDLAMTSLDLTSVSEGAKSLILHLLNLDARKRIALEKVSKHPWVVKHCLEHKREVKAERKRKRGDEVERKDEAPSHKIRLRCVDGAWKAVPQLEQDHDQAVVPKIRLRCVNGAWQSVH